MKIRFYNARILTMEKNRPVFQGEVWVQDGKILRVLDAEDSADREQGIVGREQGIAGMVQGIAGNVQNGIGTELDDARAEDESERERQARGRQPMQTWDEQVDCRGDLLLPGFKDAHTHSGMTFLRSMADDLPLQEWLQERVFPLEARLRGEDIYHLTRLAVLEYLTSGITSIFDMYLDTDAAAQACLEMGMRCVLVSGLNNFTSSLQEVEEDYVKWNHADPLISYKLGFHAEYTCSEELLKGMAGLAGRLEAPVYTHLAETRREVAECVSRYGRTPAAYLASLGLFDHGGGGYHCVHMSREDLDIFREKGLFVITNPASNLKLASGIAPIAQFDKLGIPVAIGTDGPASNNCLDMFREMFLVTGLSKLREEDASSMDGEKVLHMAICSGARAMGLENCDVLAPGKEADLILIDLHQPNMQPLHNLVKNLVYSGSKSNVRLTMIHGRILYQDGVFRIGTDPEEIYEKCAGIVKRLMTEP